MAEQIGNSFQCEVANYFKLKGWTVLLSPYYVDPMTDKTRELGMIVERHVDLPPPWEESADYGVKVRLFIECKYILEGNGYVFGATPKAREKYPTCSTARDTAYLNLVIPTQSNIIISTPPRLQN